MAGTKHTRRKAEIILPSNEELAWSIMLLLDKHGTFAARDVAVFADINEQTVRHYLTRLCIAGYVRLTSARAERGDNPKKRGPHKLYEVAIHTSIAPRIGKDGAVLPERRVETIWRTIRMLRRFTIAELAGYLSTPEQTVNIASLRVYISALIRDGILVAEGRVGGWNYLRLSKPLGPKAPRLLRAHVIYDPNAEVVLGAADTHEVAL